MTGPKRIMICPLNWGLGHASRCIPLIRSMKHAGHEVIIASDGRGASLLKLNFPEERHIQFSGHDVSYGKKGLEWLPALLQAPALLRSIDQEKKVLRKLVDEHQPDLIISDNRYGLRSEEVPSVIITHQLQPQFPSIIKKQARAKIHQWLKAFDQIWIPDYEGQIALSGGLSENRSDLKNVKFIGPLSRLERIDPSPEKKEQILAMISAPEPYRTTLEKQMIDWLKQAEKPAILLCGTPEAQRDEVIGELRILSHSNDVDITRLVMESDQIICSAGYSSIMDLNQLGRGAMLIPTPGQTEQEYLVDHLHGRWGFKRFKAELIGKQSSDRINPQTLVPPFDINAAIDSIFN